jgi:RNA polymerase sigma-70 factor (ECF subfamily)
LCDAYYAPVVAFLRREGREEDAARELAHAFFAKVLAGDALGEIERDVGRFRSYLLGAVKHFIAIIVAMRPRQKTRRRCQTQHRSGGHRHVARVDVADVSALPPDSIFDREWALAVVERALTALQARAGGRAIGQFGGPQAVV